MGPRNSQAFWIRAADQDITRRTVRAVYFDVCTRTVGTGQLSSLACQFLLQPEIRKTTDLATLSVRPPEQTLTNSLPDRGSRKHVLDWTADPRFIAELFETIAPVHCRLSTTSFWQPRGYGDPAEARLEQFGPRVYPAHGAWNALTGWWLKHSRFANTPNWDIALACEVEDQPGLVLVEAKANVPELNSGGKRGQTKASARSNENHGQIRQAICEARDALAHHLPGICIDRDRHYQLSNRLAFAWKLASLGIPTVLVYLGFLGDEGIRSVGEPFLDDAHWQSTFAAHLAQVCPTAILGVPVDVGPAKFWLLSRSRPVLQQSPALG